MKLTKYIAVSLCTLIVASCANDDKKVGVTIDTL